MSAFDSTNRNGISQHLRRDFWPIFEAAPGVRRVSSYLGRGRVDGRLVCNEPRDGGNFVRSIAQRRTQADHLLTAELRKGVAGRAESSRGLALFRELHLVL